jgi:predicted dehydrogenase
MLETRRRKEVDGVSDAFAWGIIGTGEIASQFAADLRLLPDARLAGICSRDPERAKAFQSAFGVALVYPDIDALVSDPAIDAVYIATPNWLHAEQALLAIAHGKPALVEKPLAVSAAEAERIMREAALRRCFVMEAMWTRFLPATRAAKKLLDAGAIGRIREIRAELSYAYEENADSRLFSPGLGGGAALDLGVYPVSLALHFLGRPSKVSGSYRNSKTGVDIHTSIDLEFEEARAHLSCGFDREGANQFVIEGTDGALRLEAPFIKANRIMRFTPPALALTKGYSGRSRGILTRIADRLPLPGRQIRRFPFRGTGLHFEALAVMAAVRRGETGSDIMPLAESVAALEIIGSVLAGDPLAT